MEPLSAIGLAGNIIQFADFGTKVVSIAARIYKSSTGSLQEHEELDLVVRDLDQQCSAINSALNTSGDPLIDELLASCKAITLELAVVLGRVKQPLNRHGIATAVRGSFRVLRSAPGIKDLERRLDRIRAEICARLLVLLYKEQTTLENSLDGLARREKSLHDATTKRLDVLIDGLRRYETLLQQLPIDFASNLRQFQLDRTTQKILESLHFPQIREREFTIPDAHRATFEWIFDSRTTNFSPWLRSHGGIYWISGKAGSGKSTLVKFLVSQQRTDDLLRDWAGQKRLVVASHFFWSQGTKEQRSQTGLFQTLLSQILVQCPELISFLPKRRQGYSAPWQNPWSLSELFECFSALSSAPLPSTRICLFVDGLDEYDGGHRELADILQVLVRSSDIKICTSSRPWVEFISAFGDYNNWKLAVQDLTTHDILIFVSDNLKSHKGFKDLSIQHGAKAEELVEDIANKAQGVFLWVYLAVRSLIRGMGNKDTLQDLRMRLDELPEDLERYFNLMMDSIEGIYRQRTAKIFRILLQAETTVPVLTFHFLDEEAINPDYALGAVCIGLANNPEGLKKHQLIAQCRDLVYITPRYDGISAPFRYRVGFLHRTVADYFKTPGPQALLSERSGQDFDPRVSLCRSFVALLKNRFSNNDRRQGTPRLVRELAAGIIRFALEIELVSRRSEKMLLDSLDAVIPKPLWASIAGTQDCKSFLQLTTRSGMSLYVRETALDEDKLMEALCASLKPTIFFKGNLLYPHSYQLDLKIVRELLEAGASPNSKIMIYRDGDAKSTTPWRSYIQFLEALKEDVGVYYQSGPGAVPLPMAQAYLVCRLLLSKGAIAEDGDWRLFKERFGTEENDALRRLVNLPELNSSSSMWMPTIFGKFKLGIFSW